MGEEKKWGSRIKSAMTDIQGELQSKQAMTKNRKNFSLPDFFNAKFLTEDFFVKQSKLFFLIFCLIMIFISNRYYCSKQLSEMDRLRRELTTLRNEQSVLIYRLTSVSNEAHIEMMLREKGVLLTKGNTTVYHINK
jgi:cell division protein FtsL